MATKKKAPPESPPALAVSDLLGDGANPRSISEEAAEALGKSLAKFGDLSGVVWNRRTGELVTGHQRMDQIRARWPECQLQLPPDDGSGEQQGLIVAAPGQAFALRVVDWSRSKQRLANVTANNQKLQGTFTADLSNYLLEIEAEATAELPGAFDDLLLIELMAAGLDTSDATEEDALGAEATISESYQVIVQCSGEAEQRELYDRFVAEGLSCKVLTL
jgi:hypothetical protein